MVAKKLTLEVPESVFQQLSEVADFQDRSVESLALKCITGSLPPLVDKVHKVKEMLDGVTSENLHGEIGFEKEVVNGEVFH